MKLFVCSDVHGYCTLMTEALHQKGFDENNQDHFLVVCGDLFDRGEEPIEIFNFVKSLGDRFIYIRGNHEDLLFDCVDEMVKGYDVSSHHEHNGTWDTVLKFCNMTNRDYWQLQYKARDCNRNYGIDSKYNSSYNSSLFHPIQEKMQPVLDFINEKSVNYYEVGDYIFVHGWIPCMLWNEHCLTALYEPIKDWHNSSNDLWRNARWINGMEAWHYKIREEGKTIVCGHWHCSYGWSILKQERKEFPQKNRDDWQKSFEPFVEDGIMAIDGCTAYSGIVNVIVLEV